MPYLNLAAMSLSCPGETDARTGESEWHASWDGMDADGDAMPCWDGWGNWGEHDAFPTSLNHIEGDDSKNGTWELDRGESDLDGLPCNSFSKSGWMFVPHFYFRIFIWMAIQLVLKCQKTYMFTSPWLTLKAATKTWRSSFSTGA